MDPRTRDIIFYAMVAIALGGLFYALTQIIEQGQAG